MSTTTTTPNAKPRAGEHTSETDRLWKARRPDSPETAAMELDSLCRRLEAERDALAAQNRELIGALDLACHWARHNGFGEGMTAEAPWLDKARAALAKVRP